MRIKKDKHVLGALLNTARSKEIIEVGKVSWYLTKA